MSVPPSLGVRPATPGDVPLILELIRELAVYEKLEHEVRASVASLHEHLFGERRFCEALIGEVDREPAGFALFFTSYSTFETSPYLYLEDLFVRENVRGYGLGKRLLTELARIAIDRGYPRFDWTVLDWNRPAIDFYAHLGARMMTDWRVCRLEGDALHALAREGRG